MKLHFWLGDASYEVSRDGFDWHQEDTEGLGVGVEVLGAMVFCFGFAK